jgi:hypothetical protein
MLIAETSYPPVSPELLGAAAAGSIILGLILGHVTKSRGTGLVAGLVMFIASLLVGNTTTGYQITIVIFVYFSLAVCGLFLLYWVGKTFLRGLKHPAAKADTNKTNKADRK